MKVIKLNKYTPCDIFTQIAKLHKELLYAGTLAQMNVSFLEKLYMSIATDPKSAVYILQDRGNVIAFLACTSNVKFFYKRFFAKNILDIFSIFPKLFNLGIFHRILGLVKYVIKPNDKNAPNAEILSIAVCAEQHRSGLGSVLFDKATEYMIENNIKCFKVAAAHTQTSAQKFYSSKGGILMKSVNIGKLKSSLYYFYC